MNDDEHTLHAFERNKQTDGQTDKKRIQPPAASAMVVSAASVSAVSRHTADEQ